MTETEQPLADGAPEAGAEAAVRELLRFAMKLAEEGMPRPDMVERLRERGLDEEVAGRLVAQLVDLKRETARRAASRNMLLGSLACLGGLAAVVALALKAQGGGFLLVAWGLVIFGVFQFVLGFRQRPQPDPS